MENSEVDQSNQVVEGSGISPEDRDSVAELKSKLKMDGDVLNHIDQNEQNGFSNHVSSSDKERSKDGHSSSKHSSSSSKHHSSSSSSHKHGSSSSSSHKHSSSSSHKHGSSSSKDGSSKHSSSSSQKHSSSSSSKHSSSSSKHGSSHSSSSKDKDRHKEGSSSHSSSSKDKDRSSSHSSSKDKDRHKDGSSSHSSSKDKDRHKDGSSSKDKDRHKDGSSGHSSSKDKHSSSSSSSKDKDREKDKHRESSSSKHRESSSHKESSDKPRDSSKHKEHRDKDREHSSSKHKEHRLEERSKVKEERQSPVKVKTEPSSPMKAPVKMETLTDEEDDDDVPLSVRLNQEKVPKVAPKRPADESDEDEVPLSARVQSVKKVKKEVVEEPTSSAKKRKAHDDEDYEKPLKKKKIKKEKVKEERDSGSSPDKKKKGKKEEGEVWKWWEEDRGNSDVKWKFLEHKGPVFAPPYEPLPDHVHFYYEGKVMKLSEQAEEVATFYGRMLDHDYTTREVFNRNFFKDWRKMMTAEEKEKITDLKKCRFGEINDYFKQQSEERKNRSKEEKKRLKEENEALTEEYGYCIMDNHKEKIGNFKIEPPGLFRGRGEHPKQGMLKRRIMPRDIIINCSKDSQIPQPPAGHKWKEVRHDNKVTWLASWTENIQGQVKYIMLNPASRLKGEKDWQKYETARRLHKCVDKIRADYHEGFKSKEMRIRQRSVALYFIDKLALRAGNEKDEGETADTVGCCSLRNEHLTLHAEQDGKENVVEFDFLGKDSIRYQNAVSVEKRVFKNLQLFMENKQPEDDVFDRLNTTILNKHLHDLMDGLTAKVFRTYNASRTLQEQLDLLTNPEDPVTAKLLSYNRANRAVAVLCNHQRAVPKNFSKQMENLQIKIQAKKDTIKEAKKALKEAKANFKAHKTQPNKTVYEKKKKAVERLEEQLTKLEVQATDKDENKEIALGTSKLNYLDPRISVAWCKKWDVPIEKIYNKTQRQKFQWAIDMAGPEYKF